MLSRVPSHLHPLIRVPLVFLAAAVGVSMPVGVFLATHLDVGEYRYNDIVPALNGNQCNIDIAYDHVLVRTPEGVRLGRPTKDPLWPMPAGVVLGSVKWKLHQTEYGFPYRSSIEWTIGPISDIVPAADGPPASDARAWQALITEAGDGNFGEPCPPALRAGATHVVTHHPWRFTRNVLWRLAHAPVWLGACLLIAGAITALDFSRSQKYRRRAVGLCVSCAYDLRGLPPHSCCPECGRT